MRTKRPALRQVGNLHYVPNLLCALYSCTRNSCNFTVLLVSECATPILDCSHASNNGWNNVQINELLCLTSMKPSKELPSFQSSPRRLDFNVTKDETD